MRKERTMNNKEKNNINDLCPYLLMLGIRQQRCTHGCVMVANTTMSSASAEALSDDLFPKVVETDADQMVQCDRRILGDLGPVNLLAQARNAARAISDLDLPGDITPDVVIQKSDLLKAINTGQKPQLIEELIRSVSSVCHEAGRRVYEQFDLAASKAPSKVDETINDLVDGLDRMNHARSNDSSAFTRFEKRTDQLKSLSRLKNEMKDTTYRRLRSQLLQKSQSEYLTVLDKLADNHFQQFWKKQCDMIRDRFEKYRQNSRAFASKVRQCSDQCSRNYQSAKERLTILKSGNQVVLNEASKDEFMAALMANRKVGGQAELIESLRGEFEQHLRQLAEKRGMGRQNAQRMSFRALVLGLPVNDIVDTFTALILENISDTCSFYESCQAYGLERLVTELSQRSHITSWFNGRDNPRFGITPFEFYMVRMPKPTNPKEVQIKELLESLFRKAGFHNILNNSQARSISVLRIYAGWPIGIEGGNTVLHKAYKDTALNHLPHLIGILPDTDAGKHSPALLKL